ncbi:hypothetical protein I7I48_08744 [Histoplasma ohiense]|nr:hypothetical protein I7I48_08744 [Histoplasma ohiense (nom. inval.)]
MATYSTCTASTKRSRYVNEPGLAVYESCDKRNRFDPRDDRTIFPCLFCFCFFMGTQRKTFQEKAWSWG